MTERKLHARHCPDQPGVLRERADTLTAKQPRAASPIPVVLTIDTEPDDAWTDHLNPSVANVRELLRLQKLLDEYGAKATCLVTYRVIQDDRALDVLRRLVEDGGAEIGAHLHPWETPPFMDSGLDVRYPTYPHELPLEVFERKIACLTEAIARRFGEPTCYRAGRWGLEAAQLPVLERLGYKVDTSVTPLENWRSHAGIPRQHGGKGGIDYRGAPLEPYHPSYEEVSREGQARIVEVPVTVAFTRRVPLLLRRHYGVLPVPLQRLLGKFDILRPVWAVPPEQPPDRLARMLRVALSEGRAVLNVALHSSELMLDGSPHTRTAAQVDEVFRRIDAVMAVLAGSAACEFQTLSEVAHHLEPSEPGRCADQAGPIPVRGSSTDAVPGRACPDWPAKPGLVYVLAASHSGSTLLTMLLGSHADTCTVGELKATSLGDPDRYLCSCGARIKECGFWQQVSAEMARRGVPFEITAAATDVSAGTSWYTRRLLRPLCRGPVLERLRDAALSLSPTWRSRLPEIRHRNRLLIETVCDLHGVGTVIDSSKVGLRLKYLLRDPRLDVRIVRLIRDGRAVATTYTNPQEYADARDPRLRRGGDSGPRVERPRSLRVGAHEWRRSNEEAECILKGLDESRWTTVRYEELCTDPDRTLDRLFRFLGLDPRRRIRDFRSRAQHVLGNGMRLDASNDIQLDERWRAALTPADLRQFDAAAGKMNRRYGYT